LDRTIRRCLVLTLGAVAVALVLLAAGMPGATLLAFAPAIVCIGAHLVMGHDGAGGHGAPHEEHRLDAGQGGR
jgi:hypothetical protein